MKILRYPKNLSAKAIKIILLFVFYGAYVFKVSLFFGHYLCIEFYKFLNYIYQKDIYKNIKIRRKFSIENLKNFLFHYFLNIFETSVSETLHRLLHMGQGLGLMFRVGYELLKNFKSWFKIKNNNNYNFKLLKVLWGTLTEFCLYCFSICNNMNFLHRKLRLIKNIFYYYCMFLLLSDILILTIFFVALGLLVLIIFGLLIGFLIGIYQHEDDIYVLVLILLLQILYRNGCVRNFEDFYSTSIEQNKLTEISKFPLKPLELMDVNPTKIVFKGFDFTPQIFLPIFNDPILWLDVECIIERPYQYNIELFKVYKKLKRPL